MTWFGREAGAKIPETLRSSSAPALSNASSTTLDKDFGELGVLRAAQHCGIMRLVNFRARHQGRACVEILANHGHELREAAIITAEPGRVRIRYGKEPRA